MLPFYGIYYICHKYNDIATGTLHIQQLKDQFKGEKSFTASDLVEFYRKVDPHLKTTTINWRIYSLVQKGVLCRIGRGKYSFDKWRKFIPENSKSIKSLHQALKKKYPYLKVCLWSTSIFNEFMIHQPVRHFLLVEVEKEAVRSVFFYLKELKYSVFIQPTMDLLEKYLPDEKETLIVKPLVSEAPLQTVEGVNTVSPEKMLVDVFSDNITFFAQQGSELRNIFRETMSKYIVNENKMLRYANRKRKREILEKFISNFRQHK